MPGEEDAVVPEELLLRWLNHHLRLANRPEQARAWSMSEVLRNGVGFAVVMTMAPPTAAGASLRRSRSPTRRRARRRSSPSSSASASPTAFLYPEDLTSGNARVALVVAAAIFDQYPHVEINENVTRRRGAAARANQTLDSQVDALGQRSRRAAPCHATDAVALPSHHGMIDEVVEHHAYSLPQIMEIRNAVYPVAVHLCRLFGFQMEHTHAGEAVPSSMDNQVDHVSSLLKNTMDRNKGDNKGYRTAIQQAVGVLHQQTFSNYTRWAETLDLREQGAADVMGDNDKFEKKSTTSTRRSASLTANSWDSTGLFQFSTAEEEQRWLCHAQLHQLVLWYLIWGEAANLRHAPELLCFLFHLTANAIRLPQTTPPTSTVGDAEVRLPRLDAADAADGLPRLDRHSDLRLPAHRGLRAPERRDRHAHDVRRRQRDVLAAGPPRAHPAEGLWKVAGSGSLHGTLAEKDIRAGFAFVRDVFKPAKRVVHEEGRGGARAQPLLRQDVRSP